MRQGVPGSEQTKHEDLYYYIYNDTFLNNILGNYELVVIFLHFVCFIGISHTNIWLMFGEVWIPLTRF